MFHDDIFIANSNFSSFVTNDTEHSAEAASPQRDIHSCPRCAQSSASSPHCVRTCPKFQPSAMFRQRSQLATAIGYIFQESDYLLEFTCNQQYLIDIWWSCWWAWLERFQVGVYEYCEYRCIVHIDVKIGELYNSTCDSSFPPSPSASAECRPLLSNWGQVRRGQCWHPHYIWWRHIGSSPRLLRIKENQNVNIYLDHIFYKRRDTGSICWCVMSYMPMAILQRSKLKQKCFCTNGGWKSIVRRTTVPCQSARQVFLYQWERLEHAVKS